jgi:hypothetical protein
MTKAIHAKRSIVEEKAEQRLALEATSRDHISRDESLVGQSNAVAL